jgi:hypothetical protein
MDPALFDQLQSTLQTQGPDAAIAALCARLREARDYNALFYALLMKERSEAGVSPIPTGPSQDIPEALSGRFLGPGEPPFEDLYVAYDHYLSILRRPLPLRGGGGRTHSCASSAMRSSVMLRLE